MFDVNKKVAGRSKTVQRRGVAAAMVSKGLEIDGSCYALTVWRGVCQGKRA